MTIRLSIIIFQIILEIFFASACRPVGEKMNSLNLKIDKIHASAYTAENVPVMFIFENAETSPVLLLDEYVVDELDIDRFSIWFELKIEKVTLKPNAVFISNLQKAGITDIDLTPLIGLSKESFIMPINFIERVAEIIGVENTEKIQKALVDQLRVAEKISVDDDIPGGGKISMRRPIKYVKIEPFSSHTFTVNLTTLIDWSFGTYAVKATYRNYYGIDCFKGEIESNEIFLFIDR